MKEVSEESLLGWTPKLFCALMPMFFNAIPHIFQSFSADFSSYTAQCKCLHWAV